VKYDPLLYSRHTHTGRDRSVKVGREINKIDQVAKLSCSQKDRMAAISVVGRTEAELEISFV